MERTESPRSPWRLPAIGAAVLAALALAWVLTSGGGHEYKLIFTDAGQLVKGDLVRIGGTQAGTVDHISVSREGLAEVAVTINDDFGPLHEGTSATIRAQGL